ncbi:PTS galactitol transporter subunit IIC [Clostridium sp. D2Q-14]|uniref:PTS galactitol transporter subunit IIC n=1 Tax=Anaeromonas gelatinilytica TaxID=2683194 RepID=UPI00193BDEF2|nr:PTS transporter subunit IIC [Anaeromonas gelatinilytica]MBS4535083.1 PTS galactitol transporter subunit IIC [Anaeromonas gelatinilytica]
MEFMYNAFNLLLDAGATVLLPVIITIVGLIFGLKLSRAFRSGLTVGIGFAGILLIIDMMKENLGPAAQAMVKNFGIKLDIIDVGWGSIAAVTWASPIIAILIFAILATNIIMLLLKATDTLDVDIWNYHHMAIVGIMVYFVTENVILGILATVVMAIVTFKLSDWTAPLVEDFFGIPGVSLPTMSALSSVIIAAPLNWLLDRIPGINKINFDIKDVQKYLGFFGEPAVIGLILGGAIGILAKYPISDILGLGVSMAAVMVLIPKMTSLFMEGLMPISEAAQNFMQTRFKGRNFLIGLDAAVVVGNEQVITTSLIIIPLTIAMASILPGNRVLPFADLAVVTFRVAMVVAIARGNIFKSIVMGLVAMAAVLLAGTATAPVLTELAASVGVNIGDGLITSFAATSLTVSYLVYKTFISNLVISIPILIIILIGVWVFMKKLSEKRTQILASQQSDK